MHNARTEYVQMSTHELLETRKNHNELLLQEDALMFSLQCEHLSPSSNFTLVARRSATSEGTLYRSDGGFYRTEVQVASTGVWIVGAVTVLVIFFAKILVLPPIVRKPHNYGKMEIKHNCFMYIRCTGEREGK